MKKLNYIMGEKEKQLIKEGEHPLFFWHKMDEIDLESLIFGIGLLIEDILCIGYILHYFGMI